MRQLWIIATNTLKESLRKRVLYVLLIFGVLAIGSAPLKFVVQLSPGREAFKPVQDICLSSIPFFGMLICIFLTGGLIPAEIERKTIFTLLSKPVSRWGFVLGKFSGAVLTVFINLGIMSVISVGVLLLKKYAFNVDAVKAIMMAYFQLMILTAVIIAVSTVGSSIFNYIFGFFIYIMGNLSLHLKHLIEHAESVGTRVALQILYTILPHLHDFDLREAVINESPVATTGLLTAIGYAIVYCALMLILAVWLFGEREV